MEEFDKSNDSNWSEWMKFPDPRKGEYLYAPYGCGVYQLRNFETGENILFGRGKHLAQRISSLLPSPYGSGTRKNSNKRLYVFEKLNKIEYRTISFTNENEAKAFERVLKQSKEHIFNT